MKNLIASLILMTSMTALGQSNPQPEQVIQFWDGTFMYNQLNVTSHPWSDHLYTFELSGSTLGIGNQVGGVGLSWTPRDRVSVTFRKSACDLDQEAKTLVCDHPAPVSAVITWGENSVVSKTYHGSIQNIKIDGDREQATMSFEIAPNQDFSSAQPRPEFTFPVSDFTTN